MCSATVAWCRNEFFPVADSLEVFAGRLGAHCGAAKRVVHGPPGGSLLLEHLRRLRALHI